MKIMEQLTDLHTVEVSRHGPQESYFEATAKPCCCCCEGGTAWSSTHDDEW